MDTQHPGFRRVVTLVALLNLGYFGVEYALAWHIGSVALLADSIDFLEDAAVNFLILAALRWSARRRSTVGMTLAIILLVPAVSALWTAWAKITVPVPADATLLSAGGLGALAVNLCCAVMLARFRAQGDSLSRAAYLSARNDALANVAIVAAGVATSVTMSAWPDLVVGLGIFVMNLDAARQVFSAARQERSLAAGMLQAARARRGKYDD